MIPFQDRGKEVQDYINQRFREYGINGKDAYNTDHIFIPELKECSDNHLLEVLKNKEISHVYSQSEFPEFRSALGNIFLEDEEENLVRGKNIATDYEFNTAHQDMLNDIKDRDYDEDGIRDAIYNIDEGSFIEEIAGTVIPIGLIMTGAMLYKKMKSREVKLEEAPRFFFYNAGKKTVRVAVVGSVLSTGTPIVVSGVLGYLLYKSKNLIKTMFKGIYRGVTSNATKTILKTSGIIVLASGIVVANVVKNSVKFTYKIATSDTLKTIGKGTLKGTKVIGTLGLGATYLTLTGIKNLTLKGIKKLKNNE